MKKFLVAVGLVLLSGGSVVRADDAKVEAVIAKDKDTRPATKFSADVPKLYAFFRTKGTDKGDKLRGIWIAENVGEAAPANTKIDESSIEADQDDFFGAFSLSKPNKGWPVGKYRVEMYLDDELAASVKFSIAETVADDSDGDDSKEDSSED